MFAENVYTRTILYAKRVENKIKLIIQRTLLKIRIPAIIGIFPFFTTEKEFPSPQRTVIGRRLPWRRDSSSLTTRRRTVGIDAQVSTQRG